VYSNNRLIYKKQEAFPVVQGIHHFRLQLHYITIRFPFAPGFYVSPSPFERKEMSWSELLALEFAYRAPGRKEQNLSLHQGKRCKYFRPEY